MSKKWLDTGYLKSKPIEVNHEQGIIRGVKVCSAGEAKGHGVSLDAEFISTLVAQGAATKNGLKARFGHPNMCSSALGTFIGRFKNFEAGTTVRADGTTADCAFADLFLSNSAKETPNGDLHSYVLSMAANEADMFGTSIVFTAGKEYQRNEAGEKIYDLQNDETPVFVECEKLHACDCVDEPAANDGLFSAFANETIAGQVTEFLDLHPQVFDAIQQNPGVMQALAQYGDKMDEFLTRYQEYRNPTQEESMKEEASTSAEVATDAEETQEALETVEEAETVESAETEELETAEESATEELEAAEPAAEETEEPETELSEAEPSKTIDPEEFARSVDEFGAEITATAFKAGGGYAEAKEAYFANIAEENRTLKAQLAEAEGAEPAEFGEDKGKKLSMVDLIKAKRN